MKNKILPYIYQFISYAIAVIFIVTSIQPTAYGQSVPNLPTPGTMISPSQTFVPVLLKGVTIYPDEPLRFDFIVDSGNSKFIQEDIRDESDKLLKYFLAALTVPKNDLWVNLSPYEDYRIIPEELGKTELGRDMLAQDYILKQLTASLMHPEGEAGKKFWNKVYIQAKEKFNVTEVPVNTFNKVWILPEEAVIYESGQTVYVVESRLKVLLEEDYEALIQNTKAESQVDLGKLSATKDKTVISQIIREIILPEIEREVNEGKNFAPLRQIYHALILAKWYKETIKESLLSQVYVDQNKTLGVQVNDKSVKNKIYDQYMKAYQKGAFDYIKEEYNQLSQEVIPRKYFSGGEEFRNIPLKRNVNAGNLDETMVGSNFTVAMQLTPQGKNVDNALVANLTEARIVSLVSDLNGRGVKPMVGGRDLRDFSNGKALLQYIQRYSVLKNPEDIRRVLEWKLNITESKQFGAEAEPPLGLAKETVDSNYKPKEAAEVLYNAIFDQDKFLEQSAENPIDIVLFRREQGGQQLTNLLKVLENVNVKVVVSGVEDGESWRGAASVFNATGVPIAGKALLNLAQDDAVRVFLDSRIDEEKEIANLVYALKNPGPKTNLTSANMLGIYQKGLAISDYGEWREGSKTRLRIMAEYLEGFYKAWQGKGKPFSLQNMPLRSMILAGAAFVHAKDGVPQWQTAVNSVGHLLNLREGDQVIFPTTERQHLVALREDGTMHFSEESLTHHKSDSPIVGMWLVRGDNEGYKVEDFIRELAEASEVNLKPMKKENINVIQVTKTTKVKKNDLIATMRKVRQGDVPNVIAAMNKLSSTQGEEKVEVAEEVRKAINDADVVVFSGVASEENLASTLIVPGVREAIESSNALKIGLGETKQDQVKAGKTQLLESLKKIYRYLNDKPGDEEASLAERPGKQIDYVLDSFVGDGEMDEHDGLEAVEEETRGKVSPIALKVKKDASRVFASELREGIISLLGIKRAGFKVVDATKHKGRLVLNGLSQDRESWGKGQLGLFRDNPTVNELIDRIEDNWEEIVHQGGFAFDVDNTILPKGARSVTNYARLAYVFMRLLRSGVKVAIISGSAKEEQMKRIVDAIQKQMKNDLSAMENLTFYVNGGATKVGFTRTGEEDAHNERIRAYNLRHAMDSKEIKGAVSQAVKELAAQNFGLEGEALEEFIQAAIDYRPRLTFIAPWKDSSEDFDITYHSPQEILDLEEKGAAGDAIAFPFGEERGKIEDEKGGTKYAGISIRVVPRLLKARVDPRHKVIVSIYSHLAHPDIAKIISQEREKGRTDKQITDAIYKHLDKLDDEERQGHYYIRIGGGTTIDIISATAQKDIALEDFIVSTSESVGVTFEDNKRNFFYFGDEMFSGGNDDPIKRLLPGGNMLAVNYIIGVVTPEAIHIGRSPQATLEFLEEILIKPAELAAAMVTRGNNPLGGIDMNDINIQKQGAGLDIQFTPVIMQTLLDIGIVDGFSPTVIQITPIHSIIPLLSKAKH